MVLSVMDYCTKDLYMAHSIDLVMIYIFYLNLSFFLDLMVWGGGQY